MTINTLEFSMLDPLTNCDGKVHKRSMFSMIFDFFRCVTLAINSELISETVFFPLIVNVILLL